MDFGSATLMAKLPSASDEVAFWVPFSVMVAPTSGCPLSLIIFPSMFTGGGGSGSFILDTVNSFNEYYCSVNNGVAKGLFGKAGL